MAIYGTNAPYDDPINSAEQSKGSKVKASGSMPTKEPRAYDVPEGKMSQALDDRPKIYKRFVKRTPTVVPNGKPPPYSNSENIPIIGPRERISPADLSPI